MILSLSKSHSTTEHVNQLSAHILVVHFDSSLYLRLVFVVSNVKGALTKAGEDKIHLSSEKEEVTRKPPRKT